MSDSLKQRTVNGVVWSAIERFLSLGIQMICTLVVAHFLTPYDFGLLGMVTVFSAVGMVIIDSGFGSALIRRNDNTNLDYSSVFYFNVILGILAYIILYFFAPIIAKFYGVPELTSICRITFLILPINALGLIQNTKLIKQINFKAIAIVSITAALISGTAGIIIALKIRNVWALVIQNLAMYVLRTILLWIIGNWKPLLEFSFASIKSMWGYSVNLLISGLIGSLTVNIYPLIIGKIYNATQLGYYSQADRFQKLPSTSLTEVIQRVCFPILAEVKDDLLKMRNVYRQLIMISFFIIFPIMMLLSGIAHELIIVLLGNQWETTAIFFQVLCVVGGIYPLQSINLNILNVVGKSRLALYLEISRKSLLLIFILIAMHFDIFYFVCMQVIYGIIVLFINIYFCGREINYTVLDQIKDLLPTFLITTGALITMFFISHFIIAVPYILMIVKIIIFTMFYLWLNSFFHTESYRLTIPIITKFIK